jgi:hypothetical protein
MDNEAAMVIFKKEVRESVAVVIFLVGIASILISFYAFHVLKIEKYDGDIGIAWTILSFTIFGQNSDKIKS